MESSYKLGYADGLKLALDKITSVKPYTSGYAMTADVLKSLVVPEIASIERQTRYEAHLEGGNPAVLQSNDNAVVIRLTPEQERRLLGVLTLKKSHSKESADPTPNPPIWGGS